jgi:hypothetical protein
MTRPEKLIHQTGPSVLASLQTTVEHGGDRENPRRIRTDLAPLVKWITRETESRS